MRAEKRSELNRRTFGNQSNPRKAKVEMQPRHQRIQAIVDKFYLDNGPCCAGCDWWRWHNSAAGECIKTAPVSGAERLAMLGMAGISCAVGAGHIMTPREHYCGEFKDTEGLT